MPSQLILISSSGFCQASGGKDVCDNKFSQAVSQSLSIGTLFVWPDDLVLLLVIQILSLGCVEEVTNKTDNTAFKHGPRTVRIVHKAK